MTQVQVAYLKINMRNRLYFLLLLGVYDYKIKYTRKNIKLNGIEIKV